MVENSQSILQKSKGTIICISSICGNQVISGAPITYSVAKAALNFYVKSISKVLANKNIRINAISPGNIMFNGSVWDSKFKKNKKAILKMIENNVPLRKFGSPSDIANLSVWLASDQADFITGSIFVVDGGQTV